jgi:hypothetical protein
MGRFHFLIGRPSIANALVLKMGQAFDGHLIDFARKAADPGVRRQLIEAARTIIGRQKFDEYGSHDSPPLEKV